LCMVAGFIFRAVAISILQTECSIINTSPERGGVPVGNWVVDYLQATPSTQLRPGVNENQVSQR